MKKLVLSLGLAAVTFTGSASAVSLSLIVTDAGGGISEPAGRIIVVSSAADLSGSIPGAFADILANGGTSGDFDTALGTLAVDTTVATINYSGGTIFNNTTEEFGAFGNNTYMFIVGEDSGNVTGIGAYQGGNVPNLGALSYTPGTTSALIGSGGGSFGLAQPVPEPSIALLGALGVLGLIRRRR